MTPELLAESAQGFVDTRATRYTGPESTLREDPQNRFGLFEASRKSHPAVSFVRGLNPERKTQILEALREDGRFKKAPEIREVFELLVERAPKMPGSKEWSAAMTAVKKGLSARYPNISSRVISKIADSALSQAGHHAANIARKTAWVPA